MKDNQSVEFCLASLYVSNCVNSALFMMKLTSVKEELAEAINKSTVTILTRVNFLGIIYTHMYAYDLAQARCRST
jgi:hypothetical protein